MKIKQLTSRSRIVKYLRDIDYSTAYTKELILRLQYRLKINYLLFSRYEWRTIQLYKTGVNDDFKGINAYHCF